MPALNVRELHNAIQQLRDPSHHWTFVESEMIENLKKVGFKNVQVVKKFEEAKTVDLWIHQTGSMNERSPLALVMRELSDLKVDTCMKLRLNEKNELMFSHIYCIWTGVRL